MAHGRARQIIFRIFYSTSFTIVFLLTLGFTCAGPIDAIYQSYRRGRLVDMFLIAGVYVVTAVLAIFLYASRLYTNRSLLKDIPKTYMPVDKYELPSKRVWRLIEDCKSRSAVIAYQARPRARRIENELPHARERINTLLRSEHGKEERIFNPQWGKISHPGWSSPTATDTPNLRYATVIAELTDLIEARAVSLVPNNLASPTATYSNGEQESFADPLIIEALARPEEVGMRQYISHLSNLGVIEENSLSVAFLTLYERARFSPDPLAEDEFKTLMRMFAEILRTMRPIDVARLNLPDMDDGSDNEDTNRPSRLAAADNDVFANQDANESKYSLAGSVRHYQNPDSTLSSNPQGLQIPINYARSQSSSMNDEGGNEDYADANDNWASVTSRPPFLRSPTSNSTSRSRSNNSASRSRARDLTSRIASRSRSSRLSLARLRRRGSVESKGNAPSIGSARSQGSVIRLVSDPDGNEDGQMYEFVLPNRKSEDRPDMSSSTGRN